MRASRGPLQIAIIGCGWAGARHARACAESRVDVRWAVDVNAERAAALAARLGAAPRTAPDYRLALADPDVDAVDICLPHNLHAPVALDAAAAGKHILCEKPLADTLAAADRMIDAASRAGVALMVAENERFNPVYRTMRELLQAGAIGRPALVQRTRECYLTRSFREERPWFLDAQAAAGGIMMSGGVHDFAMLHALIGDVESVYALRAPQRFAEMEGDDTSIALVRFRNGVVGALVESFVMKSLTTASGPEVHTLRVDGDLGSLRTDGAGTIRVFSEQEDWQCGERLIEHAIAVPPEDTFALEIAHFAHCLRTGETPITDGRSQRRPLEIVLAAYRSMHTGQPVVLEPEH